MNVQAIRVHKIKSAYTHINHNNMNYARKAKNNICMGKILVLVDVQTEFLKRCGGEELIKNIVAKIEKRIAEGYEIILTSDKSGGELDGRIARLCEGRKIFKKRSYGSKELILYLARKKPETVEFAGICTDICVITNVLGTATFLPLANISVDGGCCASEPEGHIAAIKVMRACNIKVV